MIWNHNVSWKKNLIWQVLYFLYFVGRLYKLYSQSTASFRESTCWCRAPFCGIGDVTQWLVDTSLSDTTPKKSNVFCTGRKLLEIYRNNTFNDPAFVTEYDSPFCVIADEWQWLVGRTPRKSDFLHILHIVGNPRPQGEIKDFPWLERGCRTKCSQNAGIGKISLTKPPPSPPGILANLTHKSA